MDTTIRTYDKEGKLLSVRTAGHNKRPRGLRNWRLFDAQSHAVISTTNFFEQEYRRYVYLQEQLALNAVRTGANLVDEERTRHILHGSPILRATNAKFDKGDAPTMSVRGWSGGHANPEAAQYGKTQIPDFWTGERFMYEVSDILSDGQAKWYLQEGDDFGQSRGGKEEPERYVCVEERFGVPIRVVAERVDDSLKCVTAFPDYSALPLDESLRAFSTGPSDS